MGEEKEDKETGGRKIPAPIYQNLDLELRIFLQGNTYNSITTLANLCFTTIEFLQY